jgi:hypothetical protein
MLVSVGLCGSTANATMVGAPAKIAVKKARLCAAIWAAFGPIRGRFRVNITAPIVISMARRMAGMAIDPRN